MDGSLRIPIASDQDIVAARQQGRQLAAQLEKFSPSDLTVIAAAISEIVRNIVEYAGHGEVELSLIEQRDRRGILIVARDQGPGIPDIGLALQDGFSTSGSLGVGLPGARRLMDEFEIQSSNGDGTTVIMRKWAR
ncbi:MAG TPA: anti-sigma regulatory factor [Gemmatimonadales bacterium]|nr:anti-sigma regulatory factor [Gemmatimonadales bacterium]